MQCPPEGSGDTHIINLYRVTETGASNQNTSLVVIIKYL